MPSTSRRTICPLLYIGYIINLEVEESVARCLGKRCAWYELCSSLPVRLDEVVACLAR